VRLPFLDFTSLAARRRDCDEELRLNRRFAPALSPRAEIASAEINGKKVQYRIESSATDQHVIINVPLNGNPVVTIRFWRNFQFDIPAELPDLGSTSQNIKPVSEKWSASQVEYVFEGLATHTYVLPVHGIESVSDVIGAKTILPVAGPGSISVTFPPGTGYVRQTVVVRFK